jgi:hypothetical protein
LADELAEPRKDQPMTLNGVWLHDRRLALGIDSGALATALGITQPELLTTEAAVSPLLVLLRELAVAYFIREVLERNP